MIRESLAQEIAIVQSVHDAGLREINALERGIAKSENDADAKLWEQARYVAERLEAGMTQRELASEWINARTGKPYSQSHVKWTVAAFEYFTTQPRPRFREIYNEIANERPAVGVVGDGASSDAALVTTHNGNSADLIASVSSFYCKDGDAVADVTFGRGTFWGKTDTSRFNFMPSDLHHRSKARRHDFRALPYKEHSLDVVVLDPPYMHHPGTPRVDRRYRNTATSSGLDHAGIIDLYLGGMTEAKRVLRGGGQLWLKCQDEIEAGKQCWSHIELHDLATRQLGFYAKDLFVLIPDSRTSTRRWSRQLHARKTHSYLWVFVSPK